MLRVEAICVDPNPDARAFMIVQLANPETKRSVRLELDHVGRVVPSRNGSTALVKGEQRK